MLDGGVTLMAESVAQIVQLDNYLKNIKSIMLQGEIVGKNSFGPRHLLWYTSLVPFLNFSSAYKFICLNSCLLGPIHAYRMLFSIIRRSLISLDLSGRF